MNLRTESTLGFVVRALAPMIILSAGLLMLSWLVPDGDPSQHTTLFVRIAGGLLLSATAVSVIVFYARRSVARHPLSLGAAWFRGLPRGVLMGASLWFLPAVITFVVIATLGFPITVTTFTWESLGIIALLLGAVLLSEAVPEELIFRGQLMSVLSERLRSWPVIVIQTGLFTAFALVLRGWTGINDLLLFISMGVGLGYLRTLTGSLWVPIGFHAAFQTGSQVAFSHDVIIFEGSEAAVMIALGALPFTVAAILVALLAPKYPQLFQTRGSTR